MKKKELVEEILERKSNESTIRDIFTFCEAYDAIAKRYLTGMERDCVNYVYGIMPVMESGTLYKLLGSEIHVISRTAINKLAVLFADKKDFKTILDADGEVELLTFIKPDSHIATIRLKDRIEDAWLNKDIEDCMLSPLTIRALKKWKFNRFCGVETIHTVKDLVVLLNTRLIRLNDIPRLTDHQIAEILENPIISNFLYEKSFKHHIEVCMAEEAAAEVF
jgi:hypothetical protein